MIYFVCICVYIYEGKKGNAFLFFPYFFGRKAVPIETNTEERLKKLAEQK